MQTVDPDLGTSYAGYDAAGRLTWSYDAKLQGTTYTYDALGRMLTKTSLAATTTYAYDVAATGYHQVGKLSSVSGATGAVHAYHDLGGRKVREARQVDGSWYYFDWTYDAAGRVKTRTFPDGDVVGTAASPWTYDLAGRLITLPGHIGGQTFNLRGQVVSTSYANGTYSSYIYDPNRAWLKTVSHVRGGTTLLSLSYGQDAKGRIASVFSSDAASSWTYGYDALDQLTSATNAGDGTQTQTFAYNSIGNMLSQTGVGTYTYPAAGQARPHAPVTVAGAAYTYDANGNMLTGGGRSYAWDGENRPTTIAANGATVTFAYGPDGARQKKTKQAPAVAGVWPPAEVTRYLGRDVEIAPNGVWTRARDRPRRSRGRESPAQRTPRGHGGGGHDDLCLRCRGDGLPPNRQADLGQRRDRCCARLSRPRRPQGAGGASAASSPSRPVTPRLQPADTAAARCEDRTRTAGDRVGGPHGSRLRLSRETRPSCASSFTASRPSARPFSRRC